MIQVNDTIFLFSENPKSDRDTINQKKFRQIYFLIWTLIRLLANFFINLICHSKCKSENWFKTKIFKTKNFQNDPRCKHNPKQTRSCFIKYCFSFEQPEWSSGLYKCLTHHLKTISWLIISHFLESSHFQPYLIGISSQTSISVLPFKSQFCLN